jgi:hypothetical protein
VTTASTYSKHGAAVSQSKYALRHLYYDADYNMKEGAGFMTGKAGARREWKLLNMGIRMGVPVVLADVTNIVRHGDLCALAGEDPIPIEVKSIKNRNARTVADQPASTPTSFEVVLSIQKFHPAGRRWFGLTLLIAHGT